MAAGQQKKRLTSSSLHEPFKSKKKKKTDSSSDCILNLRTHVDLDYDEKHKKVMARREQVGLAWKDLAPFVESIPQNCKTLADVLQIPKEIFGLEDLSHVLSYEVWNSCLSESDRTLLSQFLPSGTDTDEVVYSLLNGENLHFGNQFSSWSSSVCSGNMHPDIVKQKGKEFRSNKKTYYAEMSKYHSSMIENLERWKDKWLSCKDPEKLLKDIPNKQKHATISGPSEKTKVIKKEVPPKFVRTCETKYMSFIKINSTQLEKIKNIKHSGDGIQQKLLTPVLGDIKKFNLKSYEALEDEGNNILRDHWLKIVRKEVPIGFKAWKERKLEIEEMMKLLIREIGEREISNMEEDGKVETESDQIMQEEEEQQEEQEDEKESTEESSDSSSDSSESESESEQEEQEEEEETKELKSEEASQEDEKEEQEEYQEEESEEPEEEINKDINIPTNIQSYRNDLERIPSLNSHHQTLEEKDETETEILNPTIPILQFQTDSISQQTESDKWTPVVDTFSLPNQQSDQYFPHPHNTGTGSGTGAGTSGIIDLGMENNNTGLFCPPDLFQKEPEILPQSNFLSLQSHQAEQQRLIEQRRQMRQVQQQGAIYHTNSFTNNQQAHLAQIGPHQNHLNITNSAPRFPPGYTWFPQDNQIHNTSNATNNMHSNSNSTNNSGSNNWAGMDGSSANSDGSLFSVLSECNKIPPRMQPYHQSMNLDQFGINPGLNNTNIINNNSVNSNMFGYLPAQMGNNMNSSGGQNSVAGNMDSLAWANFRRQNSNLNPNLNLNSDLNPHLQDNMGRPFSRPWER